MLVFEQIFLELKESYDACISGLQVTSPPRRDLLKLFRFATSVFCHESYFREDKFAVYFASFYQAFRTSHISLVADYIISQQKKGVNKVIIETPSIHQINFFL